MNGMLVENAVPNNATRLTEAAIRSRPTNATATAGYLTQDYEYISSTECARTRVLSSADLLVVWERNYSIWNVKAKYYI